MLVDIGRCHGEVVEVTSAYEILTEVLPRVEPPALARQAACDLAEICLKLNRNTQAITIARELLKPSPSRAGADDPSSEKTVRGRALQILGDAYVAGQDYKRAALAYSGMLGAKPEEEEK